MGNANMGPNALTHAIYDALRAAEAVALSYAEAEANGMLWGEWLAEFDALREGELPPESFSREKIKFLRDLAASLEATIKAETTTWFVHDECDMSGGHYETATTAQGHTLILLRSSLRNLADRLSDVVKLREAEQIAGSLR